MDLSWECLGNQMLLLFAVDPFSGASLGISWECLVGSVYCTDFLVICSASSLWGLIGLIVRMCCWADLVARWASLDPSWECLGKQILSLSAEDPISGSLDISWDFLVSRLCRYSRWIRSLAPLCTNLGNVLVNNKIEDRK